jgi:hypothetical protein
MRTGTSPVAVGGAAGCSAHTLGSRLTRRRFSSSEFISGKKTLACETGVRRFTSQRYFYLRTNQPPATNRNQPAVLFSQNKPAPAISHQPTEQADRGGGLTPTGLVFLGVFDLRAVEGQARRPGRGQPWPGSYGTYASV